MTVAHYCLLAAVMLPLVCSWIAKAGAFTLRDNHDTRGWQARQAGWRARALAAQANGFEALPLLLAGLLVAWQRQAPQATVDLLVAAFVGCRVLYTAFYLADLATLRSLTWVAAVACGVALFFIGG